MKKILPVLTLTFCFLLTAPILADDDTVYQQALKEYYENTHGPKASYKQAVDSLYRVRTGNYSAEYIQLFRNARQTAEERLEKTRTEERKKFLEKTRDIRRRNRD